MGISLSLGIVNFNSNKETFNLLDALSVYVEKAIREKQISFFQLIIVSNGDENFDTKFALKIKQLLKSKVYDNCVLRKSKNYGFGAAVNLIFEDLKESEPDFVWILNTDIFFDEDPLDPLLKNALLNRGSIYGSVIYENRNFNFGTDGLFSYKGYRSVIPDFSKSVVAVDAPTGTSMLIPRSVYSKLKFPEKYFMYVEENHFFSDCLKNGYKSFVVTDSIIKHESGGTFREMNHDRWYYKVRNILYYRRDVLRKKNYFFIFYLFLTTIKLYGLSLDYISMWFLGVKDYFNNKEGKRVES